ncbi:MAG: hypothetical protein Crog4KO_18380 [Crocinitomicaceae bacterium]
MRLFLPLIFALLSNVNLAQGTSFNSTSNGSWGDPATWGGTYVSSFFPTPVTGTNWFTRGMGDTIVIDHEITMDYNIFVRDSDIVVINSSGSILSNGVSMNSIYILSDGQVAYSMSGVQAGIYVSGRVEAEYFRNSSVTAIEPTGEIVLEQISASGNFENFGDVYNQGAIRLGVSGGSVEHNAGDIFMTAGSLIHVQGGNFNNRSVIRTLPTTSCIIANNNFNNLLGAVVLGSGGFIGATTGNIDNSANPVTNVSSAFWCAGISGLNLPAGDEDCSVGCNSPLPVELVAFSGVRSGRNIDLRWHVLSVANFSHYEVMRFNFEMDEFEVIGAVPGPTNSNTATSFKFTDASSDASTINYYQLKAVDLDGSYAISPRISVQAMNNEHLLIVPNPITEGTFTVQTDLLEKGRLAVTNATSQMVWETAFDLTESNTVQMSNTIPSGIYIVHLYDQEGNLKVSEKVMIH